MAAISASWRRLASSDKLQRSSHVLSVVDGYAYAFGGELLPRQPRDNYVYKLDMKSSETPSITEVKDTTVTPSARVGTASATLNGKVYLFSGRGGEAMVPIEEQGAVWELNPSTTTWTLLQPADPSQPFPPARSYHCSTSNNEDKIYIHAGCPESGRLRDLWSFQPSSRTWTLLSEAPGPQRGGTSMAFFNGAIYRMNGFDGKTEQGGSLDVYDLASNTWSTKVYTADGISGPAPRSVSVLLPILSSKGPMLVTMFGERDPSSLGHQGAGKMLGDVWAYDINSDMWSKVDAKSNDSVLPDARGWFDADVVDGSAIVVLGGLGETNDRLTDAWLLQF
ncbi:hypothetical protein BP6252_13771 [Coleophoma cylindrospora]|uniref:Kelch repeat protein n=1 Tax=Coleophoma cylindrospora TaxID=1849047 RepID=A0A3D8Q6S1_9HELO|nr:hypothetical protein BP6252_13771 [Coleophoma cylindrospora]